MSAPQGSLPELQKRTSEIYGVANDRMFSIDDMLSLQLRFTLRAIKGIRQGNPGRIAANLPTAFSFFLSLLNRLHIDLQRAVWARFPGQCPYCRGTPCSCGDVKPNFNDALTPRGTEPQTIHEIQEMFQKIYPKTEKDLLKAGVHLAEEAGEVTESIRNWMGLHQKNTFRPIIDESADYASCFFTTANAAGIQLEPLLVAFTTNGCHACGQTQCACTFESIISYKS
jgi:NTP pyrophosphatase (non-canonical NTP hydrolase)